MKKELLVHFAFLVSLFIFISLARGYVALTFWPFWLGGIIGTLLPDVDHFIYVFLLRPQELNSQRANQMLGRKDVFATLEFLAETRYERTKLIFHTATFQLIFLVLTFLVLTSSGSLFGRGLVLGFLIHLLIDQLVDLIDTKNLSNWLRNMPVSLEGREKQYFAANLILLLIFAFFL
jgi:hypothetical protein